MVSVEDEVRPSGELARSVQGMLTQIVGHASELTTRPVEGAVCLRRSGTDLWLARSSAPAELCDRWSDGRTITPRDAARSTAAVVVVPDVRQDPRWGPWRQAALEHRFLAAAVFPAPVARADAATLSLYFGSAGAVTPDLRQRAQVLALQVAALIELHLIIRVQSDTVRDLLAAHRVHAVVDQAVGVLVAERRCTVEDAYDLLTLMARRHDLRLTDLAERVVARATGASDAP